jgi:hypothetical protein
MLTRLNDRTGTLALVALRSAVAYTCRAKGVAGPDEDVVLSDASLVVLGLMKRNVLAIDIAAQTGKIIGSKISNVLRDRSRTIRRFDSLDAMGDLTTEVCPPAASKTTEEQRIALKRLRTINPEAADALILGEQYQTLAEAQGEWATRYRVVSSAAFRKIRERARQQLTDLRDQERDCDD